MKYIHGGWSHIFHANGPDVSVRICYDKDGEKLTHMQLQTATGWTKASQEELADVEDSLKTANTEALDNPEAWGLEQSDTAPEWVPQTTTVRLMLDVEFLPKGVTAQQLADNLSAMVTHCYYNGMFTGDTTAEVDDYSVKTKVVAQPLSENAIAGYFEQRICDGEMAAEDIPERLARFGQMDPSDFDDEMRERMGL